MAPSQSGSGEPSDTAPPQSKLGDSFVSRPEVFPLIIPMPSAGGSSEISSPVGSPGKKCKSQESTDSRNTVEMVLTQLDKVSFQMCEFVIVAATVPDPLLPHVTFSLASISGEM